MELGGIGFDALAARSVYGPTPTNAVPGVPLPNESTVGQLLADNRESSANIGALAAYSGALPLAPPALSPAGAFSAPASTASSGGLGSPATSSFTPARSWASLSPQGGSDPDGSGASADAAMADLVGGGGDVFDPES